MGDDKKVYKFSSTESHSKARNATSPGPKSKPSRT